jgi:hypothetical protein
MHNWNLENIYSNKIKNQTVPLPDRLKVLGEEVSLYKKDGEDYTLIGNIDNDFYDNTLSKYIKLGSLDSVELRKVTSEILTKNNGNTPENLNSFQSYVTEGGFTLDTQKLAASESFILKCVSENSGIMLDDFLKQTYGEVDVYNQYFNDAWSALPAATVMGRAGTGELFLAFFCNGSKPEKGDLRVGSEDIEIKGFNGRLFKSKKIEPKKVLEQLVKEDYKDETQLLQSIAYTIGVLAGIEDYKIEILNLILQPQIKNDVIADYNYLKNKGWLPNLSTIMRIAGIVQLLAYKTAQKFDSMIAFNDKVSNGIWLQFINFKDINNLAELYNRLQGISSKWRTSPRIDGFGFSLQVTPKQ